MEEQRMIALCCWAQGPSLVSLCRCRRLSDYLRVQCPGVRLANRWRRKGGVGTNASNTWRKRVSRVRRATGKC